MHAPEKAYIPKSLALSCDVIRCTDEAHWHQMRGQRIQASDGSGVLVEDKRFKIYQEKVNPPLVSAEYEEWQKFKLEMEAPIRRMYRWKYGGKVITLPPYTICASKQFPFIGCTPDSLLEDPARDGLGLQQIKSWSEYDKKSWTDDTMPLYVNVQTQLELVATGLKWGVVTVAFGSQSIHRIFIEPNWEFLSKAIPLLRDFWTCVELRQSPPVDGSEATQRALERLHPHDNGKTVLLADGSDVTYEKLARVRGLMARLKKRQRELENRFREQIGPNTYAVTPQGQWLKWPTQKVKEHVVAEHEFRRLYTIKKPPKLIEWAQRNQPAVETDYKVAKRVQLPLALKLRLLRQHPHCRWCWATLTLHTATFEHVIPLDVGGTNDESNIDLACAQCNHERSNVPHALEATRY